jgi:hypothetical protein
MRLIGVKNQIDQPIYDTVQLAAVAGQTVNLFVVPFGGIIAGAVVKNYSHTNLIQAGRLEKGLELTIKAVSLHVKETAVGGARVTFADYTAVFNNSFLRLNIGQVSFLDTYLQAVPPACCEVDYYSNIGAAVTEFKPTHGVGSWHNRFMLDNPLILEDQESISVQLTLADTIAAVTDVMVILWGSMTRPVR